MLYHIVFLPLWFRGPDSTSPNVKCRNLKIAIFLLASVMDSNQRIRTWDSWRLGGYLACTAPPYSNLQKDGITISRGHASHTFATIFSEHLKSVWYSIFWTCVTIIFVLGNDHIVVTCVLRGRLKKYGLISILLQSFTDRPIGGTDVFIGIKLRDDPSRMVACYLSLLLFTFSLEIFCITCHAVGPWYMRPLAFAVVHRTLAAWILFTEDWLLLGYAQLTPVLELLLVER